MTRVEELVAQVRALPPEEQEEVRLLLNEETEDDFELSEEWREEIRRRVSEVEAGTARSRTWDEVESAFAEMKERQHRS